MITAEMVNGIVRFQANGLPVVSLYCRVDPGASQREVRARVDSLLDQIRPLAKDRALDHRYRLSVRADIERIKDALGSERWRPGTVAVFSCSGRGLYEEIPLPRRVREQVMVDATPLARPMLAVLGEYSRACVLVINREAAPVWEMYQDEMREVETVTDPLRKAANTGTRAEDRIQNRVDEQAKRHFRRVASMVSQLLRADGYDVLVVGGHDYELADFLRLLPHELRGRVAGTFRADPVATPVAEIRSSAEGVVRHYQREQDRRLVDHVLELAAVGGLAALGPENCLQAFAAMWPLNFWRSDAMGPADFECFENHYPGWHDAYGGFWDTYRQLAHPSSGRLILAELPGLPPFCQVCQLPCVMPRPDRNEFRLVEWQSAKYATCSEGCEWIFRTWPVAHAGRRQFWARYHGWDLADVIEDLGYVRPDGKTLIGQPALDLDRLWTIDDIRAIGFEVKDPLA